MDKRVKGGEKLAIERELALVPQLTTSKIIAHEVTACDGSIIFGRKWEEVASDLEIPPALPPINIKQTQNPVYTPHAAKNCMRGACAAKQFLCPTQRQRPDFWSIFSDFGDAEPTLAASGVGRPILRGRHTPPVSYTHLTLPTILLV